MYKVDNIEFQNYADAAEYAQDHNIDFSEIINSISLAVKLYGSIPAEEKPEGIPDSWPAETIQFDDYTYDENLDSEVWIKMNPEEFAQYKSDHQEEYDEWIQTGQNNAAINDHILERLTNAKIFGSRLMDEYSIKNIRAGKTVPQIQAIMEKVSLIQLMILSGSLYTALAAIQALDVDEVTPQEDIDEFVVKIKAYLGLP